jgi:hypothetical protein
MHKSMLLASLVLAGALLLLFPRQQLTAQDDGVFSTQIF